MKTTTTEPSHMENHVSLEEQYSAADKITIFRCINSLDLYGFKLVGLCQKDGTIIMQSGDWKVEISQGGLVKNEQSDKLPSDFNTWQLHNLNRLLGIEGEEQ